MTNRPVIWLIKDGALAAFAGTMAVVLFSEGLTDLWILGMITAIFAGISCAGHFEDILSRFPLNEGEHRHALTKSETEIH
tara:strand:+ start:163 stop:402 length:240 start_codon:yes stop_codon:yes gene_type:complete